MLEPSACLVMIVYGERHSHAWAPSALFSLMIVVKLREAAFGSLGLKRLCSRTCLVLICCTQSSINILRTVHSLSVDYVDDDVDDDLTSVLVMMLSMMVLKML